MLCSRRAFSPLFLGLCDWQVRGWLGFWVAPPDLTTVSSTRTRCIALPRLDGPRIGQRLGANGSFTSYSVGVGQSVGRRVGTPGCRPDGRFLSPCSLALSTVGFGVATCSRRASRNEAEIQCGESNLNTCIASREAYGRVRVGVRRESRLGAGILVARRP